MRPAVRDLVTRAALVAVGSLLAGVGVQLFLVPLKLLTAGIAGWALLVSYLTPLPAGVALALLNVPIFWGARRLLERDFLVWSLVGMQLTRVSLEAAVILGFSGWRPRPPTTSRCRPGSSEGPRPARGGSTSPCPRCPSMTRRVSTPPARR